MKSPSNQNKEHDHFRIYAYLYMSYISTTKSVCRLRNQILKRTFLNIKSILKRTDDFPSFSSTHVRNYFWFSFPSLSRGPVPHFFIQNTYRFMHLIQLLPTFSIFVISLSSVTYNVIHRDLHLESKTLLDKCSHRMANVMSYRTWRQIHVVSQFSFIAINIMAAPVELGSIYYYKRYLECSLWVEPLDRMIVLPLLAMGHLSGLAMITLHVHSGKALDPILDQIMWLFNSFGFFWILIDLSMRNSILMPPPDDRIHLENEKKDFPMLLFLLRLFVNVVSLGFIFALKQKMSALSKSMKNHLKTKKEC